MLIPLSEFVCDHCGEIIDSPEQGYLEWERIVDEQKHVRAINFKIVHHDPENKKLCAVRNSPTKSLSGFMGEKGIGNLLSFIDAGIIVEPTYTVPRAIDLREFIEIFRRLTIPYYEEGREYLDMAYEDGFISQNQYGIYIPEKLQDFIERYGTRFID